MFDNSYDSFIEEAEKLIQTFDEGGDAVEPLEKLKERALLVDMSTMAPGNMEPIDWINYISNNFEMARRASAEKEKTTRNLRRRPRILFSDEEEAQNNIPTPESEAAVAPPPVQKSNKLIRVFIFVTILCFLSYLYYSQLPPKCPHPIW